MTSKLQVAGCPSPVAQKRAAVTTFNLQPSTSNLSSAFTLVELLVVISILGLLAGLSVPALKSLGKSNNSASASRQLLDDIGRARQLAISQHTTVYMVFVKTNFWMSAGYNWPTPWWLKLTPAQQTSATNLCDKQLTGYTFISLRSVGDQPGQGTTHYLAPWQSLPDGAYIASQKFQMPNSATLPFYVPGYVANLPIYGFSVTNNIPFPTEDSAPSSILYLPYIAFNYLGQLVTTNFNGEYIPLVQGSVSPALNPATRAYTISANSPASFSETPPGNSGIGNNNLSYNIIHIDQLTGRATLLYYRVQ